MPLMSSRISSPSSSSSAFSFATAAYRSPGKSLKTPATRVPSSTSLTLISTSTWNTLSERRRDPRISTKTTASFSTPHTTASAGRSTAVTVCLENVALSPRLAFNFPVHVSGVQQATASHASIFSGLYPVQFPFGTTTPSCTHLTTCWVIRSGPQDGEQKVHVSEGCHAGHVVSTLQALEVFGANSSSFKQLSMDRKVSRAGSVPLYWQEMLRICSPCSQSVLQGPQGPS
mmetsp:Transcript_92581/g.212002  ORF Transcript_92581/g.212002 Transcript_92581/m.212002 type:complete len:230 (-) Transcript_92581:525-1214(-)